MAKKIKVSNRNLRTAARVKNDEFYTRLTDIENELRHYKKHFKNKIVLCNCDDPLESNFVKYFSLNFEHLGLKKLIATHYKESNLFTKEPPYKLEYTGDKDGNRVPDPGEFVAEMLDDGDFRSPECEELLEEADIVVTNPPFSLFREYVDQLIQFDKKFLIIGPLNAIAYKEIFLLTRNNRLWTGLTHPREFILPDGEVQPFGNIGWYTNLYHKKRAEKLTLYRKYSSKEYPKYDNYDAIEVSKVSDIPLDYKGEMGVPITFLDKYNPEQFEIIGLMADKREKCDAFIQGDPVYLDEKHKRFVGAVLSGKATYARIIVRRKK